MTARKAFSQLLSRYDVGGPRGNGVGEVIAVCGYR